MSRTRWLGRLALLPFLPALPSCGPSSESLGSDPQSTCGHSLDLQEVELYDGRSAVSRAFVNRHRLAVGLLRWRDDIPQRYFEQSGNVKGEGWCTGTLIGDDLFLTAGHCLSPEDTPAFKLPRERDRTPLRPTELAREFVVQFGYEVSETTRVTREPQTFEVVRLEEYRNNDLDYAILRLNGRAGFSHGVARIAARDAEAGSTIALLQHPGGTTMKIGAGAVSSVDGARISYGTIDTLGGSSGAGILDARTGQLVGIHTNGGCTADGGANYGVTISALTQASDILASRVDPSSDFLVGDWDYDASADLGLLHEGCLYPDANHDGAPDSDLKQCPGQSDVHEYFVGRWEAGAVERLGWRKGECMFLDTTPQKRLCYPDERPPFDLLIADWNGDGQSDLGIQHGGCIDFDINLDGTVDERGYCFGDGLAEAQYLVGDWSGSHAERVAVRRGNVVHFDLDRDGIADLQHEYGNGGNEAQYLAGDWNGDGRAKLAVRRRNLCFMTHEAGDAASENGIAEEGRLYRDFDSVP